MYLYIYEGFRGGHERQFRTDELILRAACDYMSEKGHDFSGLSTEICRTEKGKPYFKELPLAFSVSHTDDLWVCLVSDREKSVGVDIQQMRKARFQRIAGIYFTEDEMELMDKDEEKNFFAIWTRKEAYAKYTGEGLTKKLSEVSTINNSEVEFIEFDLREDVKGACCASQKGELCLRTI